MLKKSKKTIRRLGAVVMALAMAMSVMAVTAFAEGTTTDPGDMRAFGKTYSNTVKPAEALTYRVTDKSASDYTNSDYATKENIPNVTVAKAENSDSFAITLPSYTGIGKFTYNMSEDTGDTAGVTYDAAGITVVVLRTWKDINAEKTEENINTIVKVQNAAGTAKVDSVQNTFKTGSLTVNKVLKGDFADPTETFTITVTLTAPENKVIRNSFKVGNETVEANQWKDGTYTATFTLMGGESKTLSDLPVGVTYTVAETEAKGHDSSIDQATGVISETAAIANVTNEKNSTTPTGVIMNIAPYVLMVALAGGIAFFFLRRRNAE